MEDEREAALAGGMGGAVVVEGTVRRAAGAWTPTIHALLDHLAASGLDAVPRVLGTDGEGREVLSLIPGVTVQSSKRPADGGWPQWVYCDELLGDIGRWLARYHRAVRTFRPRHAVWRSGPRPLAYDEIVCHYDLRPANVVVRSVPAEGDRGVSGRVRLAGVVDWDTAGPGRPLFDLVVVAWNWIPLWGLETADMSAVVRRLGVLVEAYGTFTALEVLAAVPDRLQAAADMTKGMADAGDEAFAAFVASGNLNDGQEAVASFRTALMRLQTRLCRHVQAPCPGSDRGSTGG